MLYATAALLLATAAQAISITSPTNETTVTAGVAIDITWSSVSTDPSSFEIVLQTPSTSSISTTTITDDVETSAGSYSYTPSSDLEGENYRINFLNSTTSAILAQSDYFTIEAGSATASSSSTSGSSTSSGASTSTGASTTASGTSAATTSVVASGTSSNSSSTDSVR